MNIDRMVMTSKHQTDDKIIEQSFEQFYPTTFAEVDGSNSDSDEENFEKITIAEANICVGKLKHFFECADVEDMCALKSILTLENSLDSVSIKSYNQKQITDYFAKNNYLCIVLTCFLNTI
jgi:hypothetical protein